MSESPETIAAKGEEIYANLREEYEQRHLGRYVAIDVISGKPFVADTPEAAIEAARSEAPKGIFHLIRVGSHGAFKVGYSSKPPHGTWAIRV